MDIPDGQQHLVGRRQQGTLVIIAWCKPQERHIKISRITDISVTNVGGRRNAIAKYRWLDRLRAVLREVFE